MHSSLLARTVVWQLLGEAPLQIKTQTTIRNKKWCCVKPYILGPISLPIVLDVAPAQFSTKYNTKLDTKSYTATYRGSASVMRICRKRKRDEEVVVGHDEFCEKVFNIIVEVIVIMNFPMIDKVLFHILQV